MKLRLYQLIFASIGIIAIRHEVIGQVASFTIDNPVCLEENVNINNTSTGAVRYEWDFCSGDFELTGETSLLLNSSLLDRNYGLTIQEDEGNYYGFLVNSANNHLFRLDFGTTPNTISASELVDLGVIDITDEPVISNFDVPTKVATFQDNGNWYGILIDGGEDDATFLLDFGSEITNTPTASFLGDFGLDFPIDVDIYDNDGTPVALISSLYASNIARLVFSSGMSSAPSFDVIATGGIDVGGLSLMKDNGLWIGMLSGFNTNNSYKVSFGTDLTSMSPPSIVEIETAIQNPVGCKIAREGGEIYGFVQSQNRSLIQYKFEDGWDDPPTAIVDLGDVGSGFDFELLRFGSRWWGYVLETNRTVNLVDWPLDCNVTTDFLQSENPFEIVYSSEGVNNITLSAFDGDDNMSSYTASITVGSNTALPINFSSNDNECINVLNEFTSLYSGQMSSPSHSWDFNNDGMADVSTVDANHTFTMPGDYPVTLTIDDGTCTNFFRDTVHIYPLPPAPQFDVDTDPACSGGEIVFLNDIAANEISHAGATITYTWDFGDSGASSNEIDGSHVYDTPGNKNVVLNMSIPGCDTDSSEPSVNVIEGPTPNFIYDDTYCFEDETPIQFNDASSIGTGTITGRNWDFGDLSGSSNEINPSHQYGSSGEFDVSLTVSSDNGCINVIERTVRINAPPIASFTSDLACINAETQMTDNSTPGDLFNNLTAWTWLVGGSIVSTEREPTIQFSQSGLNEVSLTVENEAGCDATELQNIEVLQAAEVSFLVDASCVDESTSFTNETITEPDNPITAFLWDIDGENYVIENPSVVFNETGLYTASLIVTTLNNCQVTTSQDFEIFGTAELRFEESNNCINDQTILADITETGASVVSRTWTLGEETIGTDSVVSMQFSEAGDYFITFKREDDLGCVSETSQMVTVNQIPYASFEVDQNVGPPPLAVNFTNTSQNAESFQWLFGPSGSTSSASSPHFTYNDFGNYEAMLIAIDENGCRDTTSLEVAAVDPVYDLELIAADFEDDGSRIGHSLTVRNNGTQSISGFDVQIDIDNESSIIESFSDRLQRGETLDVALNFSLSSTNSNVELVCFKLIPLDSTFIDELPFNNEGCISYDQQVVIQPAYPNPATSNTTQLTLQMVLPTKSPVEIMLADNQGNLVYNQLFTEVEAGLNTFSISIAGFHKGMYFLRTRYGGQSKSQKFVKL